MPVFKVKSLNINGKSSGLKVLRVRLPVLVGNMAKEHFKEGFKRGGGMTDASAGGWAPRKRERVRDRGNPRPILVKKGILRLDIKRRETSFSRTVVGTRRADYSSYHNEGTINLPQREHIGDSRVLNRKIERKITKELDKIFKG